MSTTPNVVSKTSTPATKTNASPKRGVRKDIGMLMFLLAAETAVVSTITDSPSSILYKGATTDATGKNGMTLTAGPLSDTSSRNGETDSSNTMTPTPEEEEELLGDMRATSTFQPTKLVVIDSSIVSKVLSFVTWKDVARLRVVNKAWMRASETIVQLRSLPGSTKTAAFLLCPKDLDSDKETETALQFVHPSTWRCVVCGFWNAETRVLCGNRQCQCPSLTHAGCARIFLGQLRRDATVPFIQWLVTRVLEAPSELRNVENHRHNVTNRGKGCAWAYFKSDDVAQELLAYHRRMFIDTVDGAEGLWIVKEEDVEVLHEVASERGYAPHRAKCLPRNALVVEPPATGSSQMGRELLLSNLDVQCQYAEQEPAPTQAPRTTSPEAQPTHVRRSSVTSTATNASYSHNPYSYSPVSPSAPSYSWADNNSNAGTCVAAGEEGLPSAAAPPAYDESAFNTAPYYAQGGNHHHHGGYSSSHNNTYYSSAPTYGYDNTAYAYY